MHAGRVGHGDDAVRVGVSGEVHGPVLALNVGGPVDRSPLEVVQVAEVRLLETVHQGGQTTDVTGIAPAWMVAVMVNFPSVKGQLDT